MKFKPAKKEENTDKNESIEDETYDAQEDEQNESNMDVVEENDDSKENEEAEIASNLLDEDAKNELKLLQSQIHKHRLPKIDSLKVNKKTATDKVKKNDGNMKGNNQKDATASSTSDPNDADDNINSNLTPAFINDRIEKFEKYLVLWAEEQENKKKRTRSDDEAEDDKSKNESDTKKQKTENNSSEEVKIKWKYNVATQSKLLKTIFNRAQVPKWLFKLAVPYIETIRGSARKRTYDEAVSIVKELEKRSLDDQIKRLSKKYFVKAKKEGGSVSEKENSSSKKEDSDANEDSEKEKMERYKVKERILKARYKRAKIIKRLLKD